jgi:hypothetical protein
MAEPHSIYPPVEHAYFPPPPPPPEGTYAPSAPPHPQSPPHNLHQGTGGRGGYAVEHDPYATPPFAGQTHSHPPQHSYPSPPPQETYRSQWPSSPPPQHSFPPHAQPEMYAPPAQPPLLSQHSHPPSPPPQQAYAPPPQSPQSPPQSPPPVYLQAPPLTQQIFVENPSQPASTVAKEQVAPAAQQVFIGTPQPTVGSGAVHYGLHSQRVTCSHCRQVGHTNVERNPCTVINWLITICTCFFCIFLVPNTSKVTHSCSSCGAYLGDNGIF